MRLKPYDPRRGHLLRRFTYRGIKFQGARGWFRVPKDVADYLSRVHQVAGNPDTPLAFDVYTDEEARAVEAKEEATAHPKASDDIQVSLPMDGTPQAAATRETKTAAAPRAKGR
ncbi:MAG: hypothetical protein AAFV29_08195, partial [Myxococcota bacterium]